jgi:heparan-alpha-glucosaminide N-acetyltransferase
MDHSDVTAESLLKSLRQERDSSIASDHPTASTSSPTKSPFVRRTSIDVFRGMVMFLMLAEVLEWGKLLAVKDRFSENVQKVLEWIDFHTSHVAWGGCSLHDMIQPAFSFLVGTSLAFSFSNRSREGQSWEWMFFHALVRSLILVFLGIFLRSLGKPSTNFTFDDTLTQIGLGYGLLFFFADRKPLTIALGAVGVLVFYWLVFALYPLPPSSFNYAAVGVPESWQHHAKGFAGHWNKNSNAAWAFDVWWMNLFPREKRFEFSEGGYCTLSFIPTLGTMLLGLLAGSWMRDIEQSGRRSAVFLTTAAVCFAGGLAMDHFGICPIVKRIWTPSWVLFSGAICFLWLLVLSWICDDARLTRWSFFFRVIGANSIVAYVMSWTIEGWLKQAIERHFGFAIRAWVAEPYRAFFLGCLVLLVFWLILQWLYRRKIFVRI